MSGFRSFPCYGAQRSAQIGMIMKKVTLQDIASSLGISRTTVWKVFSGQKSSVIEPKPEEQEEFASFMNTFRSGLAIERAAIEHL